MSGLLRVMAGVVVVGSKNSEGGLDTGLTIGLIFLLPLRPESCADTILVDASLGMWRSLSRSRHSTISGCVRVAPLWL